MTTFDAFVNDYYGRFITALQTFDRGPLRQVLAVIDDVIAKEGVVWVAGNGGSAAISNHAVCDLTKWTHLEGVPTLRCLSLSCNVPMLTALGNDVGYDEVFSLQLKYYAKPGDAVLLISSSGNSPNVLRACEYANANAIPSLAFVGFKGGKLRELATHAVWIPIENYGIVEDAHQSLMHVLTQYIRVRGEAKLAASGG